MKYPTTKISIRVENQLLKDIIERANNDGLNLTDAIHVILYAHILREKTKEFQQSLKTNKGEQ